MCLSGFNACVVAENNSGQIRLGPVSQPTFVQCERVATRITRLRVDDNLCDSLQHRGSQPSGSTFPSRMSHASTSRNHIPYMLKQHLKSKRNLLLMPLQRFIQETFLTPHQVIYTLTMLLGMSGKENPLQYRRVLDPFQWAYVSNYMKWFYRVSHPIMILDALGRPPRPANHEVLKARDDHTEDVSAFCQCVVQQGRSGIEA